MAKIILALDPAGSGKFGSIATSKAAAVVFTESKTADGKSQPDPRK